MFETINNTDPLPKNYAEKAYDEYGSSQSYQQGINQMDSKNNSSLNPKMTFEDWHNNQYRN